MLLVRALCFFGLTIEPALIGPRRCRDYWNSLILRLPWVVKRQVRLCSLLVGFVLITEGLGLLSGDLCVGDSLLSQPRLNSANLNHVVETLEFL